MIDYGMINISVKFQGFYIIESESMGRQSSNFAFWKSNNFLQQLRKILLFCKNKHLHYCQLLQKFHCCDYINTEVIGKGIIL